MADFHLNAKVRIKNFNNYHVGQEGVIADISGSCYWVKFDSRTEWFTESELELILDRSEHMRRVAKFMQLAGQQTPDRSMIPSEEIRLLRAKLTFEEAVMEKILEGFAVDIRINGRLLSDATVTFEISKNRDANLLKIADGCADTSVVNTGDMLACGIADVQLLKLVDESNLAKFEVPVCCGIGMVHLLHGSYKCLKCQASKAGPYRRDDGKWIKGPDWKLPDLGRIIT